MGTIDIVILCCFIPAIIIGLKNGLIKQLIALAVIYLGIRLSLMFSDPVSQWLTERMQLSEFWVKALSFLIIFAAVAIILNLLGNIIEKIIKVTPLSGLNRLGGVLVACCITALIVSVLVYFLDSFNGLAHLISDEKIQESVFYPKLLDLAKNVFPHLKELVTKTDQSAISAVLI